MDRSAHFRIVVKDKRFVFSADLVEQPLRALPIHELIACPVGHQRRHFDVLGDALHRKRLQLLQRLFVGHAAEQPLNGRLKMVIELVKIVEDGIATSP